MSLSTKINDIGNTEIKEATVQILEAASAKKCWICGCLHKSLETVEQSLPKDQWTKELTESVETAKARLKEIRYDCLGCEICYPALAVNTLKLGFDTCASEQVEIRKGWPPFPGSYNVLHYQAPVAVCTLMDDGLMDLITQETESGLSIVGTLKTENLGLERLIFNILSNSNIRFLILCGTDSRQAMGHLPGQSLLALVKNGMDEKLRIIGAKGKRPLLKNISPEAVNHFRQTVEVIDMVGTTGVRRIMDEVRNCASDNPNPAEPFDTGQMVETIKGYIPEKMIPDPAGYFVIYVDRIKKILSLEHYTNTGVLDAVIEGKGAAELYIPVIEKGLISKLDHCAYLGKELGKAEFSLKNGSTYVQDAAPERNKLSEQDILCTDLSSLCECSTVSTEERKVTHYE